MPNTLGKNLNLCFNKIKFPLTSQPSSSPLTPDDNSSPFASSVATESSPLFKSYNSLYDDTFDYSVSKSLTHSTSLSFEPELQQPETDSEPDFATVFASQRFFFTSPGSSNSIIESTTSSIATTPESSDTLLAPGSSNSIIESTMSSIATTSESSDTLLAPGSSKSIIESTTSPIATTPESSDTLLDPGSSNSIIESTPSSIATTPESSDALLASSSSPINNPNQSSNDGCCDRPSHHEHSHPTTTVKNSVAVPTFSPNPYMDFRRSMQEMVEARDLFDVKANWDCLHELLLCYLALNPKSTHKFIIGAFADLLVSLMAAEAGGKDNGNITGITDGRVPAGQGM